MHKTLSLKMCGFYSCYSEAAAIFNKVHYTYISLSIFWSEDKGLEKNMNAIYMDFKV